MAAQVDVETGEAAAWAALTDEARQAAWQAAAAQWGPLASPPGFMAWSRLTEPPAAPRRSSPAEHRWGRRQGSAGWGRRRRG